MKIFKLNDTYIVIWCSVLLVVFFTLDLLFQRTAAGILYISVIVFSLRTTKDRYVYLFSALTSFLLILSWKLSPDAHKIWHVSIVIIWVTAISGLRFKTEKIIKSALSAIVDSSFDAIIGKTLNNIVTSWNKGAQNLFGYTSEEMVGHSVSCLIPDDKLDEERALLAGVKEGKKIVHYRTTRRHKDGHFVHVSSVLSPIKDPFGNIVGISSIAQDISERIIAENKLKELNDQIELERKKISKVLSIEEHLNTILEMNKLFDFVVEKTTEVLEAEKCSVIIVDYDTRELCIKAHKGIDDQFVVGKELMGPDSIAGRLAHAGNPVLVLDIEKDARFLRKKRGSYQTKSFLSAPIKLGGKIMGFINVADKISKNGEVFSELDLKILCMIVRQVAVAMENAKLYRDLKNLTITDPLTNIYNFRYFTTSLDHEIVRLKRHPTRPLCLFMIDVDDFKSYNDVFGHLAGDTLLQMLSKVLKESVREVDIVCRYAGDEFVVILPEIDIPDALIVAERIKIAVEAIALKRKVTVSIGIAKCSTHETNRYDLIQSADVALLNAKKDGKNLVQSSQ